MVDRGLVSSVVDRGLVSSVVDRGFDPWLGQTKDDKTSIYYFFAMLIALMSKSLVLLVWNHDNVSLCCNMSFFGLLFQ